MTEQPPLPPLPPGYEPAQPPPDDWWHHLYDPDGNPIDFNDTE